MEYSIVRTKGRRDTDVMPYVAGLSFGVEERIVKAIFFRLTAVWKLDVLLFPNGQSLLAFIEILTHDKKSCTVCYSKATEPNPSLGNLCPTTEGGSESYPAH